MKVLRINQEPKINHGTPAKPYVTTFKSAKSEFVPTEGLAEYKKAKAYIDSVTKGGKPLDVRKCNWSKTEGIQKGIKVFDGLSMGVLSLFYKKTISMSLYRGCSNACVHCFADAKDPEALKKQNLLQAMSWEDFNSLAEGFGELNRRLGLDKKISDSALFSPFFDSDCMEVVLKDKDGKVYDLVDIVNRAKTGFNRKVGIDTSGWNPKSKIMQDRAEKYVQHMKSELESGNSIYGLINLSINPFHKLHAKYVDLVDSNPDKAKLYRYAYVDRMANVFETFMPILDRPQVRLLNRALPDGSEGNVNYQRKAHEKLLLDIRNRLEERLVAKGISTEEIAKNLEVYDKKTNKIDTNKISSTGRMREVYAPETVVKEQEAKTQSLLKKPTKLLDQLFYGMLIDSNGNASITDTYHRIGTDICFNLENKDKTTPVLLPKSIAVLKSKDIIKHLNSPITKLKKQFAITKLVMSYKLKGFLCRVKG